MRPVAPSLGAAAVGSDGKGGLPESGRVGIESGIYCSGETESAARLVFPDERRRVSEAVVERRRA
jgi:hypothetical protein